MEPQPLLRKFEMVYAPINELIPATYNPRKIDADEFQKLIDSIRLVGFIDPVIANKDKTIIGGHQRVKAATQLGLTEVPVIFLDLSKDAEKTLNIRLNRIRGKFDEELLAALVQSIAEEERANTGLDQNEMENLLSKALNPTDDDADTTPPEVPVSLLGDVYVLGDHVLMCGDSTDRRSVDKLMRIPTDAHPNGVRAEMVFTDPPYNVAYKGGGPGSEREAIANDDMSPEQFQEFMNKVLANMMAYTDGAFYICMFSSELSSLRAAFEAAGGHWSSFLIWVKNTFTLGRSDWQNQYEPILYGWNAVVKNHYHVGWRDEGNVWQNLDRLCPSYDETSDKTTIQIGEVHLELDGKVTGKVIDAQGRTDIWREKKPTRSTLYPTMKPIPLVAKALMASSTSGGVVLDLFLGSGSTLIACEQTGRACRGMELSPSYVDVIVARWEKLTGKKAVRFTKDEAGELVLD